LGDEKNTFKVCGRCLEQLDNKDALDGNHWRCLSSSIWSEVPGVKVVSYRLLHQLRKESWAQDLLDSIYLDDETFAWAKAGLEKETRGTEDLPIDSNGNQLVAGDSIELIKS